MNKEMEILKVLAQNEEDNAGNIKEFIYKMMSYWYWFLLAVVIGGSVALIYNRYAPPGYTSTNSILVMENNKEGANLDELFSSLKLKDDVKLENHIGILTSFDLNYQAVTNLGWRISWFRDMPFGDYDIDHMEPYEVEFDPDATNLVSVPVYVTPLGQGKYKVSVNSKTQIEGKEVKVKFEQIGETDKPVRSKFFNFNLKQKGPFEDDVYYFVFNDPDELTLDCLKRLEVQEVNRNADIISLTIHGQNPKKDIAFLNELGRVYLEYGLNEKNKASENTVLFIDRQISAIADTLRLINEQLNNRTIDQPGRNFSSTNHINDIQRAYDLNNQLYSFLLQKRSEAEIAKASNIPDIEIFDEAKDATAKQTSPRKMANLLAGILGGLMIPFIVIVTHDYFDDTVHGREDIQKLSTIPVLGNIMRNVKSGGIPAIEYPRSAVAESLRELRTNIEYFYRDSGPVVVGIHSMVPGEGKSFVALNLAAIIATNNRKVLLIEGDLRRPSLYNDLEIQSDHGISSWLIGNYSIDRIIYPTKVKNMYFIPSGPVVSNPAELLSTKEFALLIDDLKRRFDVIIIDNSPASIVTDSALVRRRSNIDLFVVRQRYTNKKLVEFINLATDQNKSNKAGIVINDINPNRYSKYSYRYGREYRKAYYERI